jgi:uncharacterized protein (TIGR01777 family)
MRVLVTGASGMIGSAVCDSLLARGDEVVGLTRDPSRARATNPTVTWHQWNPAVERPPAEAMEGVDGVVNLVGESLNQRWTEDTKVRIRESRERATKNLVDAIGAARSNHGPSVLVSQSAVGYYGDRGDALVDESAAPGTTFDAQVCAAWEAAAHEAQRTGIRVVVTRSGIVLDPRGGMLKELLLPFRFGVGGPLAGGRQYMSWIHLSDEVGLILWALDNENVTDTLNATAPEPVTNREFSKALGRVLHRPAVMPVPKAALKARFGAEFGEIAAGGQRVIPRRPLDLGYPFRFTEVEPALRDLLEP